MYSYLVALFSMVSLILVCVKGGSDPATTAARLRVMRIMAKKHKDIIASKSTEKIPVHIPPVVPRNKESIYDILLEKYENVSRFPSINDVILDYRDMKSTST